MVCMADFGMQSDCSIAWDARFSWKANENENYLDYWQLLFCHTRDNHNVSDQWRVPRARHFRYAPSIIFFGDKTCHDSDSLLQFRRNRLGEAERRMRNRGRPYDIYYVSIIHLTWIYWAATQVSIRHLFMFRDLPTCWLNTIARTNTAQYLSNSISVINMWYRPTIMTCRKSIQIRWMSTHKCKNTNNFRK